MCSLQSETHQLSWHELELGKYNGPGVMKVINTGGKRTSVLYLFLYSENYAITAEAASSQKISGHRKILNGTFPRSSVSKESACNAENPGAIPR